MANRVLLDANALKVSRPGFNVLSATDAGLSFNSNWSQAKKHMGGTFLTGVNADTTLSYGKTFLNQPLVMLQLGINFPSGWSGPNNAFCIGSGAGAATDPNNGQKFFVWQAIAGPTGVRFITRKGFGLVVIYSIWDFDL